MRDSMLLAGVCALLCSGCLEGPQGTIGRAGNTGPKGEQGEPGDVADFSGTRLRVRYLTGEDGSKQFLDWLDLDTGEPCAYRLFDGIRRCVPAELFNSRIVFTDPACTTSALALHPSDAKDGELYAQVYSAQVDTLDIVKIGEPLEEQPTGAFWVNADECIPMSLPGGEPMYTFHEYESLPPTMFVAAEVVAY